MKLFLSRVSLRGLFFTFLALLGALYLLNFYGVLQHPALSGALPSSSRTDPSDASSEQAAHGIFRGDAGKPGYLSQDNFRRQSAVRDAMKHAWAGYRQYAFGKDEYQPLTRTYNQKWGDWAITLVDSLDTMKIMNMDEEYEEAKKFVAKMDFTRAAPGYQTMVFEMTIRALGGLLGAYELDNDPMLLQKAKQVGDVLSIAFNTPTGLPTSRVDVNSKEQVLGAYLCIAEGGTLQLEFQKLSQLTKDPKYQKLADRAGEALEKGRRKHKGLYPAYINIYSGEYVAQSDLSVGAMSDSFYEYQLKQYILSNRKVKKFKTQYITSSEAVKSRLVGKSKQSDLKFIGRWTDSGTQFVREMEHLACFYPGLLALGAHVLDRPQDLVMAEELTRTCYLSYKLSPTGLGPEKFEFPLNVRSPPAVQPPYLASLYETNELGFRATDPRYILRPETLESIFVLYRVTGDSKYQDWGWDIFMAIEKYTKTHYGYAAYANVNNVTAEANWEDSMESFFLAETLKYMYLLFSPMDTISLDEYVLNTEAHPFKIIK
ncbi:glycoside hydrolase [Martensiomyces pterosporus]|nr:glycoside hydrolase [Martensiomyces pterosporus]